ncbi:MAG: hypothetical protein ABEJ55_04210 [Halanaeroarchaeum sp.]
MRRSDRRSVLRGIAGIGTLGLAGCTSPERVRRVAEDELARVLEDGTTGENSGVTPGVGFAFERTEDRLTIRATTGGVYARRLLIRSSAGAAVRWSELGTSTTEDVVTENETAVLGPDVANWPTDLSPGETIQVVYTPASGEEALIASYQIEDEGAQSDSALHFEDGFEDGTLDGWSVVWQNFGAVEPSNEWSVTAENPISGEYSLFLDANGDPNVVATDERVIRFDRDFTLAVRYRVPNEENRGPGVRLLDVDRNGSRGNYVEPSAAVNVGTVRGSEGAYGNGAAVYRLFGHEARLGPNAVSLDEAHETRVVRAGDTITGYHDGQEVIRVSAGDIEADPSTAYRLAFRNSGTWGDPSSIYYDDVRYATGPPNRSDSSGDEPARFSFEETEVGAESPPNPWRMEGTAGQHAVSNEHVTDGERSFHMASYRDDLKPTEAVLAVDLSTVDSIVVDAYVEAKNANFGDVKLWIDERGTYGIRRFDGAGHPEPKAYSDVALDVSGFDGQHDVVLFVRGDGNEVYWDNLRFVGEDGAVLPRSEIV